MKNEWRVYLMLGVVCSHDRVGIQDNLDHTTLYANRRREH